jgi:O-acetyl-ADP-ribose deacetylase (regulator of RNase III)
MDRIRLYKGDITTMEVNAIVNAANESLLGGGGVDGAIHRAAGPGLLAETRTLGGCPTGDAVITGGYNLPASHVIHTVGPVWHGGKKDEAGLPQSCYRRSLEVARDNGLRSLAFPGISTGIYGYPKQEASEIAWKTVMKFLDGNRLPEVVWFVAFDEESFNIYQKLMNGNN